MIMGIDDSNNNLQLEQREMFQIVKNNTVVHSCGIITSF